jgi:Uma2 family endonuclease
MRAVVLDMDERSIAERHRLGLDKRDEMWKGVLHVVPPASERHQSIEHELQMALRPAARQRSLRIRAEVGVFSASDDYRVPDVVVYSDEARSERGVDGAPVLVVEIRSPSDETYEKLPWYFERGAEEVLVVDRDSLALERFTADGPVPGESDGTVVLSSLGGVRVSPGDDTLLVDGAPLEL